MLILRFLGIRENLRNFIIECAECVSFDSYFTFSLETSYYYWTILLNLANGDRRLPLNLSVPKELNKVDKNRKRVLCNQDLNKGILERIFLPFVYFRGWFSLDHVWEDIFVVLLSPCCCYGYVFESSSVLLKTLSHSVNRRRRRSYNEEIFPLYFLYQGNLL